MQAPLLPGQVREAWAGIGGQRGSSHSHGSGGVGLPGSWASFQLTGRRQARHHSVRSDSTFHASMIVANGSMHARSGGASVARLEGQIAIGTAVRRFDLELLDDEPPRRPSCDLGPNPRGPSSLRVAVRRRSAG